VPTLQEDDFTLWESNAICRYLCYAHAPQAKLWPQEPHARANVDHWMDSQQTLLNRSITVIFWNLVRTPPERRDMAAVREAIPEATRVWGMASAELAKHAYLAGDDLTLADIPWGPHLHRWFNMDFDRPDVPHLRGWYDRLLQRPAYRQHLAGPVV
jgi:glutathione S-transferase